MYRRPVSLYSTATQIIHNISFTDGLSLAIGQKVRAKITSAPSMMCPVVAGSIRVKLLYFFISRAHICSCSLYSFCLRILHVQHKL
jgi:hypothetical protein